ncbi:MAG: hypothetical protein ACJ73E_14705 [Mycobacteriales bacterium]
MSRPDRELEALLRQALAEEAGRVQPAGDGLARIRQRTDRSRGWARWRMPALALAGTAALLAAIVAAPSLLPGLDRTPGITPGAPGASGVPGGSTPAATATSAPAPVQSTAIAGAGVNDVQTVWPYPSRRVGYTDAEQDVAAGRYPDLTRPDVAAVAFVESYVGPDQPLTAVSAGRWKAGLRMDVRRGGVPVSVVYLVRVRVGNDAPYVVVEATSADRQPVLVLDPPPRLDGTATLTVGGTLRRYPGNAAPALTVQLRDPGRDEPLATARAAVTGSAENRRWSARLVPDRPGAAPTAAVAAWITDPDGAVTQFVASATAG